MRFATERMPHDPFLRILREYTETGNIPLMMDQGKVRCEAGKKFCFVKYDGNIYSCLYSPREIGTISAGITKEITDLGKKEPCPCCTECHIYPMLNFGGKNEN